MTLIKQIISVSIYFFFTLTQAQDSLLKIMITENTKPFEVSNIGFSGEGWNSIIKQVKTSQYVLIGEDHFSNEIPFFVKHLAKERPFDSFYIEVDPFSTQIIEHSLTNLTPVERDTFNKANKALFSFYALAPEYELLEYLVNSNTKLFGADQVIMYADRLVCQKLRDETQNIKAKSIYDEVIEKSASHFDDFLKSPQNPMYFTTPEFSQKMNELLQLKLSRQEIETIKAMQASVDIYKKRSHKKRIQLLKKQLMQDYLDWKDSKTLFKYGANHLARGESMMTVYDIGNMIANIADSEGKESLHIMIVGKSGMLGTPFSSFPPSKVNIDHAPLNSLKSFYDATENDWQVFDLVPIRKALNKNDLKIEDITLERVIKGYDLLVIIPELTPAKF